ncbi:MAG: hypothetical protein E7414_05870 [Ruminococcaceae bacterium]|nr:hypothetical protein [Oscillospiraceae bacterium]
MPVSVLWEKLPELIKIGGESYPIFTDFRNWIQIESVLFEEAEEFLLKIPKLLRLCYQKLPERVEDAIFGMVWFYTAEGSENKKRNSRKKTRPVFSFCQDTELIYAAFYQQYGIDLSRAALHWWQFRALFNGLTKETRLMQVISYRAADLSAVQDPAQKRFLQNMKVLYGLRDLRSEAEKERELAASFEKIF